MPEKPQAYDEIELVDILRELYRRKWILLGLTLLAGLAIAGYTLTIPNVYESSAALIVREPQGVMVRDEQGRPIGEDVQGMDVETLQTFAESHEMRWALFERLWEGKAIERWQQPQVDKLSAFRGFQGALKSSVKQMQNQPRGRAEALPILVLTVRAGSPEEAQLIANEWAELLAAKSSEVYAEGIKTLDEFVGNMSAQAKQALEQQENELVAKNLEAGLSRQEARLEMLLEQFKTVETDILGIGVEIAVNEAAIREGRRRIEEQMYEGQWIGDVVQELAAQGSPYPFDIEALTPRAREVVRWAERKVSQAESLRNFRSASNLSEKQKRLEHCELDIARILNEKAKAADELPAVRATLDSLVEQLSAMPEKTTLDKAITDDALWSAYISGELPADATLNPLKTEVENPVYQSTQRSVIDATSKIETLTSSIAQLTESAEAASALLGELESEIDAIQREIDWREAQIESTDKVLTALREDLDTEVINVETLAVENARKQEELDVKKEMREDLSGKAAELDEAILTATQEIDALEREIENAMSIQSQLASKAEEVALLEIASEQAARTGTAILYRAEINPAKVAPTRSKTVLMGMVVTFGLLCFLVIGAKLVRESGNGGAQREAA